MKISFFLQIWTRKYVWYIQCIRNLTCTWYKPIYHKMRIGGMHCGQTLKEINGTYCEEICWRIYNKKYVLLNTRFLLAFLDHMTCDFFGQYNLWWSHYWSSNRYDLSIYWSLSSLEFKKARVVMFRWWSYV